VQKALSEAASSLRGILRSFGLEPAIAPRFARTR
jgi:hypothetical protein